MKQTVKQRVMSAGCLVPGSVTQVFMDPVEESLKRLKTSDDNLANHGISIDQRDSDYRALLSR